MLSRVQPVKFSSSSSPSFRPILKTYRGYANSYTPENLLKGKRYWEQKRQYTSSCSPAQQFLGCSSSSRNLLLSAIVGALIFVPVVMCQSSDSDDSQVISVADKLFDEDHKRESLDYLKKYFENKQGKVSVPILWRLSRGHYEVGRIAAELHEEPVDHKHHLEQAYEVAQQAVKLCDAPGRELIAAKDRSAAYRWAGLTIAIATSGDTKATVQLSYTMRDYLEKALNEDPQDPINHHVMGLWAFSRASESWPDRQILTWFFDSPPPKATYEDALKHFLRAEELRPGFSKSNRFVIASCYEELGNFEEFKKWLKLTLDMPTNNREDQKAHMLANMSRHMRDLKWDQENKNEKQK